MKKNHNDSALYILKDLGNTPLFSFINDGISPISVNAIPFQVVDHGFKTSSKCYRTHFPVLALPWSEMKLL